MSGTTVIFEKYGLVNTPASYSKVANAFLTNGYTSEAGNTYFNAIRMAEGILIKEDIGQGYARTFLNGIKIYSIKNKVLIADKTFHTVFYSPLKVKIEAKKMLIDLLEDAANQEGLYFDKQLADTAIEKVLNMAMINDQRSMAHNHFKKYISV